MSARRLKRSLAGLLLAALLLFFFFRGVDWQVLGATLRSAHPGWLAGCVVGSVLTFAARAWRWGNLLAPVVRVRFWRLFSVTYVAFMAALLIPRAGEVLRPYLIGREHRVPFSAAFASIVLERLLDLIAVLVLFGLYLYALPAPAAQTSGPLMRLLEIGGAVTGVAALAIGGLLLAFHVHAERTMRVADRLLYRLPERFAALASRALRGFGAGLAVLKASPLQLAIIFGESIALWLTIGLSVYSSYRAFGVELPFHASFLVMAFLTVGVSIPTPGMVGGFHEAYRLALVQVFGVAANTAVAGGIAMHLLTNVPVLVFGLAFLSREGLTLGGVTEMSDEAASTPQSPPAAELAPAAHAERRP